MERTRGVLALQVVMNGVNIVLDLWFVLGLGWGVPGRGGGDADRRVVGRSRSGSGSAAPPSPGRSGATGPRVFDRDTAPAHGAGQRRHPGPLGDPAGELHQLPLPRRRARRRDAGGEPGAPAVPRRSPPTRSTASPSPPRRWSARRSGSAARGELRRAAILTSQWGVGGAVALAARLPARRAGADRPDGDRARGAGGGARLPALDGGGADRSASPPGCSTASSSAPPRPASCATP